MSSDPASGPLVSGAFHLDVCAQGELVDSNTSPRLSTYQLCIARRNGGEHTGRFSSSGKNSRYASFMGAKFFMSVR